MICIFVQSVSWKGGSWRDFEVEVEVEVERGCVGLKNSIIRETYYAIYYLNVFQNRKHGD